jgi:Divergent InlB B-repeat domain
MLTWVMNSMKNGNSKSLDCAALLCCVTLLFGFSAQASGQEDGTALMLEMSPPKGGTLNIMPGVHSYDRFAAVTLTATPMPGYRFVYWLGNVADATTGTTTVFLNSPKMVIAVFERDQFETVAEEGDYTSGGGNEGGGGLVQSGGASDSSLEEAGGGKRPPKYYPPTTPEEDVPVPVPEPVTAALFFAGFLMLTKSRRNGANITEKT